MLRSPVVTELILSRLQAGFTHNAVAFIQADFIQPSVNCTKDETILFSLEKVKSVLLSLQFNLQLDDLPRRS